VGMPAGAAPSKSLGMVAEAQLARLGAAVAINGATVFAGDRLATDSAGSLRLSLGGAQLYLLASSAVALAGPSNRVTATVQRGTAGFATSAANSITLRALEVTIRPTTTQPTHGQVSVLGPNELLITSFRGPLAIDVDGVNYAVPSGASYRMELTADAQEPQGTGAPQTKRRRVLLYAVALGVAGLVAGIIVWRLNISPDRP
jgi:hypothetical protein